MPLLDVATLERGPRSPGEVAYRVTVVDFGTGRLPAGHQEHYLSSLESALSRWDVEVIAPFRDGTPGAGRPGAYVSETRTLARVLAKSGVVVCHTPELRDFVAFAMALIPHSEAVGVFVLRRDAAGIVGRAGAKARVLEAIVRRLVAAGRLYPASDSRPALAYWQSRAATAAGSLLAIPPPPRRAFAPPPRGRPVIGIPGVFRNEKGAAAYDTVVRAALRVRPEALVRVQLGEGGGHHGLSQKLGDVWAGESRVKVSNGFRPPDEYAAGLAACDVVVLPYDVSSYGLGTSGVLHDAVELGCVALATPIAWAAERYTGDPRVVWLEDVRPESLERGIAEALARARELGRGPKASVVDTFAADWQGAIEAAWDWRAEQRGRKKA